MVPGVGLTTVMSAPTRVSQNGEIDCLTDTDDAPLPLALDDHEASPLAALFAAARCLTEGMVQRRGVDIELAPVELVDVDVLEQVFFVAEGRRPS